MIKRVVVWVLLIVAVLFNTQVAFSAPPQDGSTWNLTFADEFNGTKLDATKWVNCYPWGCGPNSANGELQGYSDSAVTVANGFLNITGTNKAITVDKYKYKYTSGMITTHTKFSQVGGYYEARIKFPKGNGAWGAMWYQKEFTTGSQAWPPEVDVVEFIGNDNDGDTDGLIDYQVVNVNRHFTDSKGQYNQSGTPVKTGIDLTQDYHIYGVDIRPDKNLIDFYLDGKKIKTLNDGAPNVALYGLLNLAIGGNWPGNPDATTKWPLVMSVDYYRSYVRGTGGDTSIPPTTDPGIPTIPTVPSAPVTKLNVNCVGTIDTSVKSFTIPCTVK